MNRILAALVLALTLVTPTWGADVFSTDATTPRRATVNGTPFFPRIFYDSGESSNFADQSVINLNLGQYKATHYLNYQWGPLPKVTDQLGPLSSLGMYGFATGNSVTEFPALPLPGALVATASGTAGNVNVGTHSYQVVFTFLGGSSSPGGTVTLTTPSGNGVTATASGTPFVASDIGRTIWSGTGRATIVGFTSSSVVTVDIVVAFSSTTLSSWTIHGGSTNGGAVSNIVTVSTSAKQVNLTSIPVGPPGTVYRKIYRTVAGNTGSSKFVMTIFNNTATTATDNVADANLGPNVPTGPTLAVIENTPVSGTPFRTYFNTAAGMGGFYLADETQGQAQESALGGYRVFENALYWRGIAEAEMPNVPRLYVLFPEGPLVPETSTGSGVESQFGSAGFTEHLLSVANVYWWNRNLPSGGNDWIGYDQYPNFRNETLTGGSGCNPCGVLEQGGFPHFLVADAAAQSVAAATASQKVPILTLQLFGPFQAGRFPTPQEMWQHVTMAVAEGIRGLAWWQIGTNLGLRDQLEPTKTNANTALINITTFLQQNESTILSPAITGRLTNSTQSGTALNWRKGILPVVAAASQQTNFGSGGRGAYTAELNALNAGVTQWSPMLDQNGDVRHRVFRVGSSLNYLVFAYNYATTQRTGVTFTFDSPIASVTVVDESRTITPTGATWTDSFGGSSSLNLGANRNAHIYQVSLVPSVAFQSKTTAGNGTGGLSQQCQGATTCSGSGHTVSSGATCLTATLSLQRTGGTPISGISGFWAGQPLTVEASRTNGTFDETAVILRRVNPTPGTGPLVLNWTGTGDAYMASQAWTGTDTATCVKTADNVTGIASPLVITSGANDATLAMLTLDGDTPVMNQTTLWGNQAIAPGGGASYALGGTSNTHTFTNSTGTTRALAGVHILNGGPPDTIPPTDPSSLVCTGVTSSTVSCAWTGSTDVNTVSYSVEQSSGATCTGFTVVGSPSVTSLVLTGQTANATRCYRVRATDGPNFSGYSNTSTTATLALQSATWHWTDLSNDETNFALYRCQPVYPATTCDPTVTVSFATVGAGVVDFIDSAAPAPTVCMAVNAQKTGAADSGFTNTKCVTAGSAPALPPLPPNNLRATGLSQITLAWLDLSTDELNFKLESRPACGSGSFTEISQPAANATSAILSLPPTSLVEFRIRASNAAGDSPYSNSYCWSRWGHSTAGMQVAPPTHGTGITPPVHGSLP